MQPAPQPAPGASSSALASRKTALLANARLTGSEYDAATAVRRNLGNGTNAQYAKADYKNMTTSKTEIDRLVSEMSPANVKPTKAKLDELQLHLNNYNAAYKDFQTHAKASGSSVAAMPQPQVIINNNVHNTTVNNTNTTVNNNTTDVNVNNHPASNTVVNPAHSAPPPPKPVLAPKEFSLRMSGGTFMKMATSDNTGESAVYTGSYRSGTGMQWLYKYEVVCVRSGKGFVIDRVQRTKALFSTGLTVGAPESVPGVKGACQ